MVPGHRTESKRNDKGSNSQIRVLFSRFCPVVRGLTLVLLECFHSLVELGSAVVPLLLPIVLTWSGAMVSISVSLLWNKLFMSGVTIKLSAPVVVSSAAAEVINTPAVKDRRKKKEKKQQNISS